MEPETNMYGAYIDASDYTNRLIHTRPSTNSGGIFSQISSGSTNIYDPFDGLAKKVTELEIQSNQQGLVIKLLRLKIHALEGKFTQEEVANIRKMIMSEDEGSRTLADSIIENA
jgi:hypothetical protein